eukprot:TRINITY_DN2731_c0_g1_i6.p1 TRINITY_DN2731_c0_g1~~TRINITY_DN2731_c0_g1_i6.p1  ORF type:complete len:219 (-),score=55.17 TRINITY_DN2731_c0_g1_i6:292-948(-)
MCIRDRYQRRVHGDREFVSQKSMISKPVQYCLLVLTVSAVATAQLESQLSETPEYIIAPVGGRPGGGHHAEPHYESPGWRSELREFESEGSESHGHGHSHGGHGGGGSEMDPAVAVVLIFVLIICGIVACAKKAHDEDQKQEEENRKHQKLDRSIKNAIAVAMEEGRMEERRKIEEEERRLAAGFGGGMNRESDYKPPLIFAGEQAKAPSNKIQSLGS